jgi:hypothetical protein
MDKLQLKVLAKAYAEAVHYSISWENPLEDDDVVFLTEEFKKELNKLNGND